MLCSFGDLYGTVTDRKKPFGELFTVSLLSIMIAVVSAFVKFLFLERYTKLPPYFCDIFTKIHA